MVSALDWGFGHTGRTSVLIKQLIALENTIFFAGNDRQNAFIKKEFPLIETIELQGYKVQLDSKISTYKQIIRQAFKIKNAIKYEQNWLKNIVKTTPFDFIISDNRYGFYHPEIPNVILTHQISMQIPFGKRLINYFLKLKINKFDACWIPDDKTHSLSGKLSQGKLKIPIYYIGPLSRFNLIDASNFKFDYLFMTTGPEPECHQFLEKVITTVNKHNLIAAIAVPKKYNESKKATTASIYYELDTKSLEKLINSSKVVVSRSGYTTIMDLTPNKKPMILIPTKNQFEQLYLSTLHGHKNISNSLAHVIKRELS